MTLNQAARAGGALLLVAFLTLAFLWGNQRLALAEGTDIFSNFNNLQGQVFPTDETDEPATLPESNYGSEGTLVEEEWCHIVDRHNDMGQPFPIIGEEDCGGEGGENPPPPPPPPPPPGGGGSGGGVENTLALCTDGIDNDGDSKIDLEDPDCADFLPKLTVTLVIVNDNGGTNTAASYSLSANKTAPDSSESVGIAPGFPTTLSSAGTWTLVGYQKGGYTATFSGDCNASGEVAASAGETKNCTITSNDVAPGAPACSDGIDNDGDGLIDMADPGCSSPSDDDETNSSGGGTTQTSSGGGGGGGGGGGWFGGPITQATTSISQQVLNGAAASITSCDQYLTEFIRVGKVNTPEQVRRLQVVLREFEKMTSVEITGVYDEATLAAVHVFQTKYASEILTPWGISESTGFVYLTTRKKVNEIYCHNTKLFPLTAAEKRIIDRARAGLPAETNPQTSSAASQSASAAGASKKQETEKSTSTSQGAWWDPIGDFLRGLFRTPR